MGGDLGIWLACQVSLVSAPVVYAFNTEPSSRHTQGMALNQAPLDSSRRAAWCGKASFGLAWSLSGSAQTDALTRFAVFDTLNIVLDAMLLMDILVRSLTAPCPNEHASWLLLVASSLGAVAHFDAQLQAQAQACIPANCACRCLSTYVPSVTRAS